MSNHNEDTYIYVCNGAQHSSGYDMNHRFWFRPSPPSPPTTPASCKEILDAGNNQGSGRYTINPAGTSVDVFCDMERAGGGWTLALKTWYQASFLGTTSASGAITDALTHKGTPYKLSDADISGVIGTGRKFDFLADQSGFNSHYSNGNYEYVVVRDYTADWTFGALVADSETTTTMTSYRLSDDAIMDTFNFQCGPSAGVNSGARGVNCLNIADGTTRPAGGSGCYINVGKRTNDGWHHLYMSNHNEDTYIYVCNGAQHSSSYDMNHRFWFRESAGDTSTFSAGPMGASFF